MSDITSAFIAVFLFGCIALAVVFFTPFAAVGLLGFAGWHIYKNHPNTKERIARERTMALYHQAIQNTIGAEDIDVERELDQHLPGSTHEATRRQLIAIGVELLENEHLIADIPEPPLLCDTIEGGRYRDMVLRLSQAKSDPEMTRQAIKVIGGALSEVALYSPKVDSDIFMPVIAAMDDLPAAVGRIMDTFFFSENDYGHFNGLRKRLNLNYQSTHRLTPVHPSEYKGDDIVQVYLAGTPLEHLFDVQIPFGIPEDSRFEHTYILGGTGSGKTTAMKRMIANDLREVEYGGKSVIVIDSQNALIPELLELDFPYANMVVIDVDDVEFPVALNLFSVGQDRFDQYSALEREQLRNSIIELYEFVLASLMDTGLTGQQRVIFRYGVRLMLSVPDATLHTFLDLMEEGGKERYQKYIDKLDEVPRRFFESQFDHNEFKRMRQAVLRRFYIILENAAFERMFRNPKAKLDLFTEINAGKLILINTSKATLKEEGTATFGRFFVALIAQAAAERAMISEKDKTPTIVYLDEAHEYLDTNVNVILAQARKQKVGLVMAHQYLGQIKSADIRAGLEANTSIKMAGNISASDARALSSQMSCDVKLLQNQPTFTFMTYVRGLLNRAMPVAWLPGALDEWGERTDMDELRDYQRSMYANPLVTPTEDEEEVIITPPPDSESTDY